MWPQFIMRHLNPWVRYGFNKCEMCGRYSFKQMEVGLYWTCARKICIQDAIKQDEEDYQNWK